MLHHMQHYNYSLQHTYSTEKIILVLTYKYTDRLQQSLTIIIIVNGAQLSSCPIPL